MAGFVASLHYQCAFASRELHAAMSNKPNWLTEEYIQKFLLNAFDDKELKLKDFEVCPGSSEGDGFLSQILRIQINTTKKKFSVIAKVLLNSSAVDKIQGSTNVYVKEKMMLQSFLPESFKKLPKPDRFFAKFYYADDDHQALFLEDLCEDGFQLCEHSGNGLDLQHSLLVMETLAKLHGTSYLVFKENPSLTKHFEKYYYVEESREFSESMVKTSHESLMEIMDDWKLPEEYKKKLRNVDHWASKIIETWKRKDDQLNVMIQTDCWANNLMFKYNQNGVEAVKMVDFQLATYHSFAFDLGNFIFTSANTVVRVNHVNTLLDHYFEIFTGITGKIPGFSKEKFQKEFTDRLFGAFFTLVCWGPIVLASSDTQALDLDAIVKGENNIRNNKIYQNPKFLDCIEKLMPYFVQNNVI